MKRALVAALALSACYDPHPPSGAYTCDDAVHDGGVGACPSNQTCECGQCVDHAGQAACSFQISVPKLDGGVAEHQPFDVTVTAYAANSGGVATAFAGNVTLSSTWGDVCVGTSGCVGLPHEIALVNGVGTAKVQLNRETISPQTAVLRASFAGATGTSGDARIEVYAPPFGAQLEVSAPVAGKGTFGFATQVAGAPAVVKTSAGWSMYFIGNEQASVAIGYATSTDGKTFTPSAQPVYVDQASSTGTPGVTIDAQGHATLIVGQKNHALTEPSDMGSAASVKVGFEELATLSGPLGASITSPAVPLLESSSCPFCAAFDTPSVIVDPNPALSGGSAGAKILYFSALPTTDSSSLIIGRALAPDGQTYTIDPSALLKATSDEVAIYSPHVVVDGTVYKMWYALLPTIGFLGAAIDPCLGSQLKEVYRVGYATSSDGSFWVRSPTNVGATPPYLFKSATGTYESMIVTSVVARDGVDPSSGLVLYFSRFSSATKTCLPDGIYRVERE